MARTNSYQYIWQKVSVFVDVDEKSTNQLQSRLHSGCVDSEERESGAARVSLQVMRWPTLPGSANRLPLMKCATCLPDEICPTRSTLTDPR